MTIIFGSPEAQKILEADRELQYEKRTEIQSIAICPNCKKSIELIAETEAWFRQEFKWVHDEFGPATGYCEDCGILIVDSVDGCFSYGPD